MDFAELRVVGLLLGFDERPIGDRLLPSEAIDGSIGRLVARFACPKIDFRTGENRLLTEVEVSLY